MEQQAIKESTKDWVTSSFVNVPQIKEEDGEKKKIVNKEPAKKTKNLATDSSYVGSMIEQRSMQKKDGSMELDIVDP